MKNSTIRIKFLIIAIIVSITFVISILFSIKISKDGYTNISEVVEDTTQVKDLQESYISPLYKLRELSLSLVMAPDEHFRKELEKNITPLNIQLNNSFKKLNNKELLNMWEQYRYLVNRTNEYIRKNFEEGAFINANTSERKQFSVLIEKLEMLQKEKLENSKNIKKRVKEENFANQTFIILALIILGITCSLIGLYIANNIVSSIDKVKEGLDRFFNYLEYKKTPSKTLKIELDTKDELGEMAEAINKEIILIRNSLDKDMALIEEATLMVKEIENGNLEKRLKVFASSEELNTLKNVMNQMVSNLENKIQEEISQRTSQEKLLIQQSKLASMGNMIGNIAHQWRQPINELNSILIYTQMRFMYDGYDSNFLAEQIEKSNKVTEYMSNTITDFQNFFKPSKKMKYFNIIEACQKAISIIEASLKYNEITINFKYEKINEIKGYPNEFSQAFLNILSNAKDVLIERKIKKPTIDVLIKNGEKFILIKVLDNGGGIKEENIESIFEPYFTTKNSKKGTGIGLYMTKMIIESNMNGIINVNNDEEGACFIIKLKKENIL